MEKHINRRNALTGAVAIAASAFQMPAQAQASAEAIAQSDWEDGIVGALQGLVGLEIQGQRYEPQYLQGTMIFVRWSQAASKDHVLIRRKALQPLIAQFVHADAKSLYVRGFKAGERMQAIPKRTVTEWGRIVLSFKP